MKYLKVVILASVFVLLLFIGYKCRPSEVIPQIVPIENIIEGGETPVDIIGDGGEVQRVSIQTEERPEVVVAVIPSDSTTGPTNVLVGVKPNKFLPDFRRTTPRIRVIGGSAVTIKQRRAFIQLKIRPIVGVTFTPQARPAAGVTFARIGPAYIGATLHLDKGIRPTGVIGTHAFDKLFVSVGYSPSGLFSVGLYYRF